jgi:hypothetical protein
LTNSGDMNKAIIVLVAAICLSAGIARSQDFSVKSMPPSVIKTVPQCGDTNVDANELKQIRVTFSKDMMNESWSWSKMSEETFPKIEGKPRYLEDKRTCVVYVELEPKKTYVIWFNTEKFRGFQDTDQKPAFPYLLVFQTK